MADRTGEGASAVRHSVDEWTAVRERMLAKAWSFADKLADTCDDRWLRLGLAAPSRDDNGTDFRDTYVALGDLYIGAARCGMERGFTWKKQRRSPPATRTWNSPR